MDQKVATALDMDLSPYQVFTEREWARLRADTPMTLDAHEVAQLQGLNAPVSIEQVETIYLPLSRLLAFYAEATISIFQATQNFLGTRDGKTPFIIGVAGSVSVGKSTTSRVLRELLARWPASPKVDLITTDGFLYPNAVLEAEGLMSKKGFPESFDRPRLLKFLSDIKAGKRFVRAPVYSHFYYDVMPGHTVTVDRPDILIVEGLNVLQTRELPKDGRAVPFVSDFFDFSVYIDADETLLLNWYVDRFMRLRETAFRDPGSYFHKYSRITDQEAITTANRIWNDINLVNLRENILPTRPRADLILTKDSSHKIAKVALRKI
ncbi:MULTISPECIES: type I pantothenate kinase [Roseibium]|jgi:type I pantothenate kinase|uniref:Pantothenate kinase n=1 Tax=Roseibium aggregatum (strain ATCC 25650 / DSM 13394 / JCM 20685 / NBRC 16684 / NCIMB 2208 / IAM 12614 / B1) TaxID=384765 RepID=A0P3M2_ROSAI|nr:type I pantothenate kinase [Roseibium aggregatum]EAV40378.1 pantothenate kinase [Stappia aggregata IAM 12614] [Roseibium aggregatum IAM 12614]MEE4013238.1 type I pantothenate kinase [Roseibium sp. FZY0029]